VRFNPHVRGRIGELRRLPFGELIGDPADKDLQQRPELFLLGG